MAARVATLDLEHAYTTDGRCVGAGSSRADHHPLSPKSMIQGQKNPRNKKTHTIQGVSLNLNPMSL